MPPRKRVAVEIKAEDNASPVLAEMRRDVVVTDAVEKAFEVWRNRPGRADPVLVREALHDAASRAYGSAQPGRDVPLADDPPPYVLDLLDAFLTGKPLNFRRHRVPIAIQQRLDAARESGQLGTVPAQQSEE